MAMKTLLRLLVAVCFFLAAPSFGAQSSEDEWTEAPAESKAGLAVRSPLFVQDGAQTGPVRLGFDKDSFVQMFEQLEQHGQVTMPSFLPKHLHADPDSPGQLILKRVEVFTEDAIMELANRDGSLTKLEQPKMVHLHGSIAHDPSSFVLLNIGPAGSMGMVTTGKGQFSLERDPDGHSVLLEASDEDPVEKLDKMIARHDAGAPDELEPPKTQRLATVLDPPEDEMAQTQSGVGNKYYINLAIDCDQRCVARLNQHAPGSGQGSNAQEYMAALIAGVSVIYQRDLGRGLKISYVKYWNSASSFDSGVNSLTDYRTYWKDRPPTQDYDVAHLMTGIQEGGVAYLGTVCRKSYNVGVSSLRGQWKGEQHSSAFNWDLEVTAHELGHNFGSGHSHDYDPPIDECVSCREGFTEAQCKQGGSNVGPVSRNSPKCVKGTIMSYCHLCGGVANLNMHFHPRAKEKIMKTTEANCGPAGAAPPTPPPTPPPPTPAPTPPCNTNTGGTCWWSSCYSWRNAQCVWPKCKCPAGKCASGGKCV